MAKSTQQASADSWVSSLESLLPFYEMRWPDRTMENLSMVPSCQFSKTLVSNHYFRVRKQFHTLGFLTNEPILVFEWRYGMGLPFHCPIPWRNRHSYCSISKLGQTSLRKRSCFLSEVYETQQLGVLLSCYTSKPVNWLLRPLVYVHVNFKLVQ